MTRWAKLASLAAIALAGFVVFAAYRAHTSLIDARRRIALESSSALDEARLDRSAPVGYESIGSPAAFRDAVRFQGKLYLCAASGVFAYDAEGTLVDRYRSGFALPSTKLVAAAVASTGAREMYVATESEGLLAFHGRLWRQIRPRDAALRHLTALLPLETGRVLLGTARAGLLVYDPAAKSITPFHATFASLHVTALAGNEGDLWIGTIDRGAIHWRGGQSETFTESSGLPDPQVLSIALAGSTAYIGTPLGVAEFVDGKFGRKLAPGVMAKALLLHDGKLMVGTLDEGTMVAGPRGALQAIPARVERLLELDGDVYALSPDGLFRAGKRVLHPDAAVLADGNISALSTDSAGRLWVGYFDRGLDVVSDDRAEHRTQHIEDEHAFCVNRIVQDPRRGLTAVATANGLVMYDASVRQRQLLGRSQGLIADHVTDVLFTADGMTIATPAGITFANDSGMRSLYAFHGLVNNHVYALASSALASSALAAAKGKTFAGTLGGISVLEGDRPTLRYTTANSALKQNWITAIVSAGDEWFAGTYGDGVVHIDAEGRLQRERDWPEYEVNPGAMLVTPSRIYAGTLSQGLQIFDRATRRWHRTILGLPSQNVTALAAHGSVIYIGTDNGLIRVAEADLQ